MVLGGWYFGYRAKDDDRELPVYVTGGERMAAGEEIYRRGADAKPFTYPPFAAVPFVPFALLPREWQPPAWFCVNFVILVAVAAWLHAFAQSTAPGEGPPRVVWFWVLTVVVGGHHVVSVFTNQSHDLFVAGAVVGAAAAWTRGRSTAGLWAGLGGAIKATPLLLFAVFAVRRRALAAALAAAAFAALSFAPDLLFPRTDGRSWLLAWYDVNLRGLEVGGTASAAGAWNPHSFLNQSLSGTLARLLTEVRFPGPFVDEHAAIAHLPAGGFRAVTLLLQVGVLALLAFGLLASARAVRSSRDPEALQRRIGLGDVAAVACGMVLLSPQSSKSHFCVWLLPAAFLADRVLRGPRDRVLWALLGAAVLLGPLASKGIVGREFGNRLLAFGNVTWCTVVLLVATVRCLRRAGSAAPSAAVPKAAAAA
jgi:hypothetical protein